MGLCLDKGGHAETVLRVVPGGEAVVRPQYEREAQKQGPSIVPEYICFHRPMSPTIERFESPYMDFVSYRR